jgi:hypothetical protein
MFKARTSMNNHYPGDYYVSKGFRGTEIQGSSNQDRSLCNDLDYRTVYSELFDLINEYIPPSAVQFNVNLEGD